MKSCYSKSYLEILPAALLSQRQTWQEAVQSLPAGACLLITDLHHSRQTELMQILACSFRRKGRPAIVWTPAESEVELP